MSATIFGTVTGTWPSFGVENGEIGTITMNTKSTAYEADDAEVRNELGAIRNKAKYNKTDKITFEGTIILPGHLQDVANGGVDFRDAFIQIDDVHGNVRDIIMESASIDEDNTAFVKISGEGTYYPDVAVVVTEKTL